MTARRALRLAAVDFYRHSWRLAVLNAVLATMVLTVGAAAILVPAAAVLVVLVGPVAAGVMYCAVTLAETEQLRLGDALVGVRRCWRRGAALAVIVGAATLAGAVAVRAYAHAGTWGWPLAALALYLLAIFGVLQLWLWPLAVAEHERSLGAVFLDAVRGMVRRPLASLGLAAALTAVNVGGFVAALLPLLTLTLTFSFLAAAHLALPELQRSNQWRA
jgi:hypothetical protein